MEKAVALNGYTPTSLHYVRNHGPAPQCNWNTHTVQVSGLVDKPYTFSMDELVALPSVTIPVTLVRIWLSKAWTTIPKRPVNSVKRMHLKIFGTLAVSAVLYVTSSSLHLCD